MAASSKARLPFLITGSQGRYIFEIVSRIIVVFFFLRFAVDLLPEIIHFRRLSSILALALTLTFSCCILFRRISVHPNFNLYDWFIAFYGTLLPLLLRSSWRGSDSIVLTGLQTIGTIIAIVGILSLNRSFGIVAGNRGVQTVGLYRYVRHPIYAGYFLSIGAIWGQNLTLWNSVIFAFWVIFEILRIFAEERQLMQDAKYKAYSQEVRWRLLPRVF